MGIYSSKTVKEGGEEEEEQTYSETFLLVNPHLLALEDMVIPETHYIYMYTYVLP